MHFYKYWSSSPYGTSPYYDDYAKGLTISPDGGSIYIVGYTTGGITNGSGANENCIILKADDKGNLIWSKIYGVAAT